MTSSAGETPGTGLPLAFAELARTYHQLRWAASGAILVAALALCFWWERPELLLVGAIAGVAAADGAIRSRHPGASPLLPVLLDTAAIGLAMILGRLPLPVIGAPFAYLVSAALLLLPPRAAGFAVAHASAWGVIVVAASPVLGSAYWTTSQETVIGALAALIFFSELAALVARTAKVLRARQHDLERLVRSKDEFIASVSHELRTPLTAVIGFSQQLQGERGFPQETAELLGIIASEAQEVADIVDDLLVAARADIGAVNVRQTTVDLGTEVRCVIRSMEASVRGLTVEGEGEAWADPARTRQIIRNLVTNAGRYGGSRVRINIVERGEQTVVEVADDGQGVPGELAERLFQPYQRAVLDGGPPMSMGLGLFVARTLARLMGGDLTHRQVDGWTVFSLQLPRDRPGSTPAAGSNLYAPASVHQSPGSPAGVS